MKKRFLSLLTALAMVVSLAACGSAESDSAAEPVEPDVPVTEQTPVQEETEQTGTAAPEVESGFSTVVVDGLELGAGLIMDEEAIAELDANPDKAIDRAVEPIKPVPDAMLDGTILDDAFYYYRSTLDDTQRQAYDLIRAGIMEGKEKIKMTVPVSKEAMFELYKKIVFDSPELFWVEVNGAKYAYNNQGHVTYFYPGYNDLVKDIAGNTAELEAATAEALADLWSLPTDAEKAKYAHDWLTYHITYDINAAYHQTSYSSLVNHASVCAGYAHGFQYLMQQVGIPCAYVLGYAMGGYHAWNVVLLDGEHYAMDVTWDDPLGAAPGKFYYNYFNITDQKLSTDHIRAEISAPVPAAQGTACSYQNAFGGNAYGTDFNAIVGVMPEKVTAGEEAGSETVDNPYLS